MAAATVVLAVVVRVAVVTACRIPSSSMAATLLPGDRVLVNRLAYLCDGPHRGHVVAVRRGDHLVVKRCTAGPGDTVRFAGGRTLCLPAEGERLWFLTGDNAGASYDSRFYGPVPERDIVGRVELVFWSAEEEHPLSVRWSRIGKLVR